LATFFYSFSPILSSDTSKGGGASVFSHPFPPVFNPFKKFSHQPKGGPWHNAPPPKYATAPFPFADLPLCTAPLPLTSFSARSIHCDSTQSIAAPLTCMLMVWTDDRSSILSAGLLTILFKSIANIRFDTSLKSIVDYFHRYRSILTIKVSTFSCRDIPYHIDALILFGKLL
jgi:hypothetical protein